MNYSLVFDPPTAMGETPLIVEDAITSQKSPGSDTLCYSVFLSLVCQEESGEHYVTFSHQFLPGYQEALLSSHSSEDEVLMWLPHLLISPKSSFFGPDAENKKESSISPPN